MGQKVHPIGFRLGYIKSWQSSWFATKDYAELLHEDIFIRRFLKRRLKHHGVASVGIERAANRAKINIWTSRPGLIIGRRGQDVDRLKVEIQKAIGKQVAINIREIRRAEVNAQLVAENVAVQLERRVNFRTALKKAVSASMRFGAEGIKIMVAGRLGGAEIARREWYREGRVPLHTLRADIDYGFAESKTTYGIIGVKVWIFNGEVLPGQTQDAEESAEPSSRGGPPGRAPGRAGR